MAEKLSAAQRSKIRRLSEPKEHAPDEAGGELNIVPFLDIITNVLMFVLATITVTFTATVDTDPPRPGTGARPPTTPTLSLTLLVVPDGFSIKTSKGNVAPGCNDVGSGVAIPKKDGDFDYASLKQCAMKLKASSPEFKDEQGVTILANPPIPYQVVISTMDAVRNNDTGESMFPDVTFGVAR